VTITLKYTALQGGNAFTANLGGCANPSVPPAPLSLKLKDDKSAQGNAYLIVEYKGGLQ